MFTYFCIQIVIIKLYSQNLICKYITHHHTHEKSGTINKQILNLSDGKLLILVGIEPFSILMLTRVFLSSATPYWTILNILSNFISLETIFCDHKDPRYFNKTIKSLIREKKNTFNKYRKNKNNIQLLQRLKLQEKWNSFISVSKQNYYSRMSTKLTKFHKSSKAYWSLLKTFLNNKKIPLIPPLYHQGGFITNFKVKAELFNSFFASQCSLIKNDSKLPSYLNYNTDNRLSTVNFSIDDIAKIIQNLDPNKAHGHDKISIRMLQLCGNSICKPLELIF